MRILEYYAICFLIFLIVCCQKEEKNYDKNVQKLTLVSPLNESKLISTTALLKWEPFFEGKKTSYTINFGMSNPPENEIKDIADTTYLLTNLKPNCTYYWYISVKNDDEKIITSEVWKFITGSSVDSIILISPEDKTQLDYLHPLLKWNLSASNNGLFQIYIANDTSKWIAVDTISKSSYVPKKLSWSTTYYWKVVSKSQTGEKIISSDIWSFKTPPEPVKREYESYKGLIMAGYQGWFACEGDGSNLGWTHYSSPKGPFSEGYCSIDFWPDISEYEKTYETNFVFSNGEKARVFSSYDEQTVLTHFRWMEEYGIDGVFLQRFMSDIKYRKQKTYKVFDSAMKGAQKYHRVICLMYDGGVGTDDELLKADLLESNAKYDFKNNSNYLKHNGRPLVALWGIGFSSRPDATPQRTNEMIDWLNEHGFSVLLGVNNDWRSQPSYYTSYRKADIIHPWFVGRYSSLYSYETNYRKLIKDDLSWCKENGIDYVPTVFPGFSWHNMNPDSPSDQIPRDNGNFFWGQIYGNISDGALMIYVAMFDEMDEGTCIFKCAQEVPTKPIGSSSSTIFVPYRVESDYYLWLTGEGGKMLRKEIPLSSITPQR